MFLGGEAMRVAGFIIAIALIVGGICWRQHAVIAGNWENMGYCALAPVFLTLAGMCILAMAAFPGLRRI